LSASPPAPSRLIAVGRVAGGFGVRGEVRITTFTEDPLALKAYRDLKREDGSPGLTILTARAAQSGIIGRVKEIDTKEQADAMRGLMLYVARESLPEPDEDEFYLTDLVGLKVETQDGRVLGKVAAVPNFGAGDLIEIDPGDRKPTWYLAFTRETVPQVLIAEGKLIAVLPAETSDQDEG
jgi:16S rRNA processing protein RimM